MNDPQIRQNFHKKKLKRHHADEETLVIDELGLNHGACRADIAVINGHLEGYEIKSDRDTLGRLERQIESYNAVFDRASIVVGERHVNSMEKFLPEWWGIVLSTKGSRGAVRFKTLRRAKPNGEVDLLAVARLLWRSEAADVLSKKDLPPKVLRSCRAVLYQYLVDLLSPRELKRTVRQCLKTRENWRCPEPPSLCDDLCLPESR